MKSQEMNRSEVKCAREVTENVENKFTLEQIANVHFENRFIF